MRKLLLPLTLGLALVAGIAAVLIPGRPAEGTGASLTAIAAPTWQTNASVLGLKVVKGRAWVGGAFTKVRPPGAAPGSQETARSYLAVFDSNTGALNSFNATLNGRVWAIEATDTGSRVFIGGDFTTVNGQARNRLAAFDTATGKLVPDFRPSVDWRVKSITSKGNVVYFGGSFNKVNGAARTRMAAVAAHNGQLLTWWPTADWDVHAMEVTDDGTRVVIGGGFAKVNSQARWALASVAPYPGRGAMQPFAASGAIPQPTETCVSRVKDVESSGNRLYIAAAGDGGGCFDGTVAAEVGGLGKVVWKNLCLGATETLAVHRGWLFKGSHAHDCRASGDFPEGYGNKFLLMQNLSNGRLGPWYPNTDAGPPTEVGPLVSSTDGTQLWVGGDFLKVNKVGQQGLTRFNSNGNGAVPSTPPAPTVSSTTTGRVDLKWQSSLDNDDTGLTYRVKRFTVGQLVTTKTATSTFWSRPTVTAQDTTLKSGTAVAYRIEVTDGKNTRISGYSAVIRVK